MPGPDEPLIVEEEQDEEADPVLLDTDVFSFLLKGPPRAELWRPVVQGKYLLLSFVTVAELLVWAETRNWGEAKRQRLQTRLDSTTVVPFNEALIEEWARLTVEARAIRHPLGEKAHANDAWIAATARLHGLPLATGNVRDYAGISALELIEP